MTTPVIAVDTFTPEETRALSPYFTNTDRPVFALTNLPETVKGALFARYSRSAKSLRRLFPDGFPAQPPAVRQAAPRPVSRRVPRPDGRAAVARRLRRRRARRQVVRARAERV